MFSYKKFYIREDKSITHADHVTCTQDLAGRYPERCFHTQSSSMF